MKTRARLSRRQGSPLPSAHRFPFPFGHGALLGHRKQLELPRSPPRRLSRNAARSTTTTLLPSTLATPVLAARCCCRGGHRPSLASLPGVERGISARGPDARFKAGRPEFPRSLPPPRNGVPASDENSAARTRGDHQRESRTHAGGRGVVGKNGPVTVCTEPSLWDSLPSCGAALCAFHLRLQLLDVRWEGLIRTQPGVPVLSFEVIVSRLADYICAGRELAYAIRRGLGFWGGRGGGGVPVGHPLQYFVSLSTS